MRWHIYLILSFKSRIHHRLILTVFSLIGLVLLGACATPIDFRDKPDFGFNGLQTGDPLLATAALAAEYVTDIYANTFLLGRIAEEYQKQNQIEFAKVVLHRAVSLTRKPAAAPNRYQLQVELARLYLNLDDAAAARPLLQEALEQTLALTNEDLRGAALESIIERAFQVQESFPDILRTAIDYIYVLQDPIQRVGHLVVIGKKYQDLNVRNRTDNLIQEAIAAAASITNTWAKARAYVLIARRFSAQNDTASANLYISQALEIINTIEVLAISDDDAEILLDLIVNLADAGRFREAGAAVSILPNEQFRINAQLAIIERAINQKADLQARLLLQRLLNQLYQQDPENKLEISLSSLLRLADIYQSAGQTAESIRYARSAMPYLSSANIINISAYRSRLALILARNGLMEEAIAGAGLIPDAWIGSQTLRQLAEILFQRKDIQTKNRANSIRALLIEAEQLAGQAAYLRESAFADVAATSFRTGDDIRAIRLLQDITDPYLLGKTLSDAASARPSGIPLSSDARLKLELLWKRLLALPPKSR